MKLTVLTAAIAMAGVSLYGVTNHRYRQNVDHNILADATPAISSSDADTPTMTVRKTDDFTVTGDGVNKNWDLAQWQDLTKQKMGDSSYKTKVKALYSSRGIYFLFDCEDNKLTCDNKPDNGPVYEQDAVEVFLWPNEQQDIYFEYELSPLGAELPLLVPNHNGDFMGWLPWQYTGRRKVQKATAVRGGVKGPQAIVTGWTAEIFIPFRLLTGLGDPRPKSGTHWRANFNRLDYDDTPESHWTWSPHIGSSFHNFQKFGTIKFE